MPARIEINDHKRQEETPPDVCDYCERFFNKFSCTRDMRECDCPKCQGYCECEQE